MFFHERFVVPPCFGRDTPFDTLDERRAATAGRASGRVLEVGIGTGRNLPHYQRHVSELIGVDPLAERLAKARRTASFLSFPVTLLHGSAAGLPLDDGSIDHAVMTWTLCSVDDPLSIVKEIRRVLKDEGQLSFIEHGRAETPWLQRWQDLITPTWQRLCGGCRLNRQIDRLIEDGGFQIRQLETGFLLHGPHLLAHHYQGIAHPS